MKIKRKNIKSTTTTTITTTTTTTTTINNNNNNNNNKSLSLTTLPHIWYSVGAPLPTRRQYQNTPVVVRPTITPTHGAETSAAGVGAEEARRQEGEGGCGSGGGGGDAACWGAWCEGAGWGIAWSLIRVGDCVVIVVVVVVVVIVVVVVVVIAC